MKAVALHLIGVFRDRVLQQAGILLLERSVRLVLGFCVTGIVARYLGVSGFGAFNYGLAVAAMCAGVAQLGMDSVLVREFAARRENEASLAATSILLRLCACCFLWAIVGLIFGVSRSTNETPAALVFVCSISAFQSVASVPYFWFQAHLRAWVASRVAIYIFVVVVLMRLAVVGLDWGVIALAAATSAESVLSFLAGMALLRKKLPGPWLPTCRIAKVLFAHSWPIWIGAFAYVAFTRGDQLLLSALGGVEQLGLYAAALRLTEHGQLVPLALANPMLGSIAKNSEPAKFKQTVQYYSSAAAIAGYGFALMVWVLSPFIFGSVFGSSFEGAGCIARVHSLTAPLIAVGLIRNQVLIARGNTLAALIAVVAGMCASLGLDLALIPRYGALGAAWGAVLGQAVSYVISTWWFPNLRWLAHVQAQSLFVPWRAMGAAH